MLNSGPSLFRLFAIVLLLFAFPAAAAPEGLAGRSPQELFPSAQFDPSVPTLRSMFGFDPGARPLRHDELLRYFRALAEASPRARLDVYAESHEGRELVVFAVSDVETIARLDDFKREHAARVDPRGRAVGDDAARLENAKAVAWMAYSIHGDELSSADAAAALAYWLVAGEDAAARRLRERLLILIDPCENPDGRDRFLAQTRSFAHKTANPDTEDLSHTTVWPWGRGNHYLFDLNRDWFSMVQPESERSAVIASWHPQLMVDSHEMGAHDTYLFPPSRHPFNPHLPTRHEAWIERFSADQARALDRHGYPYYTREWNEEFFPGYGSSWASYLGAIGILYEMSSTEGTLVKQRAGGLRTYAEAVEHHVTSSVANLTTLADNRGEILADFVADRRRAIAGAGAGAPRAWILPRGRRPERSDRLVRLLARQGIEVWESVGRPDGLADLRDARTGEEVPVARLPERVYMVPLDQPAGPLARNLLDPHVPMESGFFRDEREYLERGRGTRLYEVTAWSLPLAFDVEAHWTSERPGSGWRRAAVPPPAGRFDSDPQAVVWAIDGADDRSLPVLAHLLQHGVRVRIAEKPFEVDGRRLERSALVLRREGNPDDLEARLRLMVERFHVDVHALTTSRAAEGPDLGGRHFQPLIEPRVGIWSGWPVSPTVYGALWHLLDEELGLRFNGLDVGRFAGTQLDRYNVLIFPSTFGNDGYGRVLGKPGVAALKRWIEAGGTAIGVGNGAAFLADVEHDLTRTRLRRQALERYPPVVLGVGAELAETAGPLHAAGLRAPEAATTEDSKSTKAARKGPPPAQEASDPYDVAPIVGPGARPFVAGQAQGRAASAAPVDLKSWLTPLLAPGKDKPDEDDLERADARLRSFSPRGAFLRVELDRDHWLAWGLPAELPALVRASDTLVAERPVEVAARFVEPERLHLGGLLWPEAAGRLARTAYATRESRGRGQIVLFLEEPEFRGWTLGTRRLLVNAILYGPGLGTRWSNPW